MSREQIQQQQRAQLPPLPQLRNDEWASTGITGEALAEASGIRPTEPPGLRQCEVFKNPLHVHARSVRVEQCCGDGDAKSVHWELAFRFDALEPAEVIVYVGTGWDGPLGRPPEGEAWSSEAQVFAHPRLGLEYRGAIDLAEHSPHSASLLASGWGTPASQLCFCIELRCSLQHRLAKEGVRSGAAEWTQGLLLLLGLQSDLGRGCSSVAVEVQSQSVRLAGMGLPLLEREVFGAEADRVAVLGQASHDCVICMAAVRDTAVLPCRHMCLCGNCAETMRSRVQYRSYRCPICRERVSSLLQIRRAEEVPADSAADGSPQGAAD